MINFLLLLVVIVIVYALVISFVIRKRTNHELDKGVNPTTVKHPFLANPMIIAYVLFPILVIAGAIIWLAVTE